MRATSVARNATRSMRIIALPLTPHRQLLNSKQVEHLTYYHFVTPPEDTKKTSWPKWAVAKASDLWAGLGKAPESSWKVGFLFIRQSCLQASVITSQCLQVTL